MINLALFGYGNQRYFRRVVKAAVQVAHADDRVRFRVIESVPKDMWAYPDLPDLHGAIAPGMSTAERAWFEERHIPVIYYSSRRGESELPPGVGHVCADDHAIGALASGYFQKVGLTRAAFFGLGETQFALDREQGFRQHWAGQSDPGKCGYHACLDGNEALGDWLPQLPLPIGIFCDQDHHARSLIEEALRIGLRVPEDVAVIGVDGEMMVSELCPVRITSVEPDAATLAQTAIRSLVHCIETGTSPETVRIRIPPKSLVFQKSAPYHYSTSPEVNRVLLRMETSLNQPLRIDDLAREAGVSRRSLETRFKETLGASPYQKLLEMRLDQAKRLLRHSNHTMSEIAERCGFTNAREFSVRFKSKTGVPPKTYRESE